MSLETLFADRDFYEWIIAHTKLPKDKVAWLQDEIEYEIQRALSS